jgi:hypothetical protein
MLGEVSLLRWQGRVQELKVTDVNVLDRTVELTDAMGRSFTVTHEELAAMGGDDGIESGADGQTDARDEASVGG